MLKLILFLTLCFPIMPAMATSAGISITKSSSSSSTTLSGSYGQDIKKTDWAWEAFLDITSSSWTGVDSTTGAETSGISRTNSLGVTFDEGEWSFSPGLTLTEDITNKVTGTELNFGSAWKYRFEKKDKKNSFVPWIKLSGKVGLNSLKQTSSGRRSSTQISLNQRWLQFGVSARMIELVSAYIRVKKYSYPEDPASVIARLDTTQSRGKNSAPPPQGFSDTLTSLLSQITTVGVTFYPLEQWDISLYRASSINEVDESTTIDTNIGGYYSPNENWTFGLNLGQTSTSTSTSSSSYSGASAFYDF